MFKRLKKTLVIMMAGVVMMGSFSACGDQKVKYTVEQSTTTEVLKIGDYKINLDEMLVYIFQQMYTNGVTTANAEATAETMKTNALSDLRQTYIIYDVAMHNDVEITDADKATSDEYANNFVNVFKPVFDQYGITEEAVKEVFYKQMVVQKFENDIKNQMGQQINDDFDEMYKDIRFVEVYQYLFPTIEVDESENPVTDADGNYVSLSDEEKAKVLETATAAQKECKNLSDCDAFAAKYGISTYSRTIDAYIGGFTEDIDALVAALENGEATEVQEVKTGYFFYYMVNRDDEGLKSSYAYSLAKDKLDEEFETLQNKWLSTIPVDTVNDVIGTTIEEISVADMAQALEDAGIATATNGTGN